MARHNLPLARSHSPGRTVSTVVQLPMSNSGLAQVLVLVPTSRILGPSLNSDHLTLSRPCQTRSRSSRPRDPFITLCCIDFTSSATHNHLTVFNHHGQSTTTTGPWSSPIDRLSRPPTLGHSSPVSSPFRQYKVEYLSLLLLPSLTELS